MRRFDDQFLALAYGRIEKALVVCTIAAAIAVYPVQGWQLSAGVVIGGFMAMLNFVWMRKSMVAFSDRVADALIQQKKQSVKSAVFMRFFLRYALMVMVVSVIISRSPQGAEGVLIGLLLVVPALLFEVVYEAIRAYGPGE